MTEFNMRDKSKDETRIKVLMAMVDKLLAISGEQRRGNKSTGSGRRRAVRPDPTAGGRLLGRSV